MPQDERVQVKHYDDEGAYRLATVASARRAPGLTDVRAWPAVGSATVAKLPYVPGVRLSRFASQAPVGMSVAVLTMGDRLRLLEKGEVRVCNSPCLSCHYPGALELIFRQARFGRSDLGLQTVPASR